MQKDKIFRGEDIALQGRVDFDQSDTSRSLEEYELDISLSTSPIGQMIVCSSKDPRAIPITMAEGNSFCMNIPSGVTEKMLPGILRLKSTFTHKATGVKTIGTCELSEIVEPF